MKALEGELAGVKGERDARVQEISEATEVAELTLLLLHQVQEELENVFLADQAKQKQLEGLKQQALRPLSWRRRGRRRPLEQSV